jgi:GIY-YIG catalytic domain-containing protein
VADLAELIMSAARIPASRAASVVPDRPGYYSIWLDDSDNLPRAYADRLRDQRTHLIYVGIATRSLMRRLVRQDLYHKSPSTFSRGIGAVLGYRPPHGSLVGRKNQNNYRFGGPDSLAIIAWAENHLKISIIEESPADKRRESDAIHRLCPILNSDDNPRALKELAQARLECREIAKSVAKPQLAADGHGCHGARLRTRRARC